MIPHHIEQHNDTLTCAACAWRAVFTTDQRIIQTEPGDPGHDHIGQAQALRDAELAERRQLVQTAFKQLQSHFMARRPIFWELYRIANDEGMQVSITRFPGTHDDGTLNMRQFRDLYKCIQTEHGI